MENLPNSNDTFLQRICKALDKTPRELAKALGIRYKELEPLLAPKSTTADIDQDEVWWLIFDYASKRLAMTMAVRDELNTQLQKDRAKRIKRHERFKAYHGNRSSSDR